MPQNPEDTDDGLLMESSNKQTQFQTRGEKN
jgi:hypothetical protein